jgi:ribonucleoside-diphosphate reductase alpha chain
MSVNLSENALKQFENLYSFTGETVEDTFRRVSGEFSKNEEQFDFAYNILEQNIWRPNTPAFLNAGTNHKVFSACYVVGLEDSMESIYDIANIARKIFQFGSGIGIPIGNLRERESYIFEGDPEKEPEGRSSGPITFMKLFDAVGETTKSGGRVRRAAILTSMLVHHPDIMEYISCKEQDGRLANMNISVNITDVFMKALNDGIDINLISPNGDKIVGRMNAQEIWDRIADMAWKSADPGIIFIDNMNKYNPLIKSYKIEATNPCGEQPLLPFGCCNLSAINVAKFVKDGEFDWILFYDTVFEVMELMDNVIDVMNFPEESAKPYPKVDRFRQTAEKYRQVGIGPMGLADALYMLGLRYDGPDGRKFAGKIMKVMTAACAHKSALLAKEYGPFYEYELHKEDMLRILSEHMGISESEDEELDKRIKESWELVKKYGVRNAQFTTAQPTGTTALSCDASYGIEPMFGLVFYKNYIDGTVGIISNPIFHEKFKNEEWYTDELLEKIIKNKGSLKGIRGIPEEVRKVFVVAHDINYKSRVDMQAEIQKYCSTAISSTVNLPKEVTKDDISDLYKYAWQKGLKGITIYRDGSKKFQPVTFECKEEKTGFELTDLPSKLNSTRYKLETGNGRMYVNISDYKSNPLEVFIYLGKSGQILNTFSEAMGRLISIALQSGVSVESISKTLIGINSDKPIWYRFEPEDKKPSSILSIPDGIGQLLSRYYSGKRYEGELSGEVCPKCGKNTYRPIEGCWTCIKEEGGCGYSKCS